MKFKKVQATSIQATLKTRVTTKIMGHSMKLPGF